MHRVVMALIASVLIAGCGGGTTATTTVPDAAPAASGSAEASASTAVAATGAATTGVAAVADRTQVSGPALPQFEQLENDPAVGRTPPVVVGADLLTGETVRIESQGRPMAVAFYAHWCPHCQAEVADLTTWLESNDLPAGVDFFAVSVLEDAARGNHPPATWLRAEGWQHPVVADTPEMSAVEAFGLTSVPYLVAVDADNKVALRYAGSVGPTELAAFFATLTEPAG